MDFDIVSNLKWIGQHIWAALRQMGGVAILTVIITFIVHKINTRFEKHVEHKYDQKLEELKVELDKQRENYRTLLDKRNHVSKTRFDTEFTLCREIMVACHKMINDCYFLFPTFASVPADEEARKEYEKEVYDNAYKSYAAFISLLIGNAPFISETIYDKLYGLGKKCRENLDEFSHKWNLSYSWNRSGDAEEGKSKSEAYKRTRQFQAEFDEIVKDLRGYFANLDVIE